jgi:hypothetical protein
MKKIVLVREICLWLIVAGGAFAFLDNTLQDMTRSDCKAGISRACADVRS